MQQRQLSVRNVLRHNDENGNPISTPEIGLSISIDGNEAVIWSKTDAVNFAENMMKAAKFVGSMPAAPQPEK